MPLKVHPTESETKEAWDKRCMSDTQMNSEFPRQDQRYAVCQSKWQEAKKSPTVIVELNDKGEEFINKHLISKSVNTVMIEENAGVIAVATENFVGYLNFSLCYYPGSTSLALYLGNPGMEQREAFLKKYLSEFAASRVRSLAQETENFSCAHLRELVNRIIIEDSTPDTDDVIIEDMRDTFTIPGINTRYKAGDEGFVAMTALIDKDHREE